MGAEYSFYAEAKVNGEWRGIDLYARGKDGQMIPIPLFEGKSVAYSMMEWCGDAYQISRKDLSPELKADHAWLMEEKGDAFHDGWLDQCVSCIEGADIEGRETSLPEHCGFVSKELLNAYKKGETEEILEWMSPADFKELPEDVRQGYAWFEWTEPYGDQENFVRLRQELAGRVMAYNLARWSWPFKELPPEITMKDTRVVIISS